MQGLIAVMRTLLNLLIENRAKNFVAETGREVTSDAVENARADEIEVGRCREHGREQAQQRYQCWHAATNQNSVVDLQHKQWAGQQHEIDCQAQRNANYQRPADIADQIGKAVRCDCVLGRLCFRKKGHVLQPWFN